MVQAQTTASWSVHSPRRGTNKRVDSLERHLSGRREPRVKLMPRSFWLTCFQTRKESSGRLVSKFPAQRLVSLCRSRLILGAMYVILVGPVQEVDRSLNVSCRICSYQVTLQQASLACMYLYVVMTSRRYRVKGRSTKFGVACHATSCRVQFHRGTFATEFTLEGGFRKC